MAKSTEDLLQENNELLRDFLRNAGRSSGGGGTSGSGGGGSSINVGGAVDAVGSLGGAANKAAGAIIQLWQGSYNASKALSDVAQGLSSLPLVGRPMSGFIGAIEQGGQALLNTNNNLNEAARSGANFNNNLVQYDNLVKGARLTQEQYNDIVAKNSTAMNGLGGGVNRSQTAFLTFGKEFIENNKGLADTLRARGYTEKEIAEFGVAMMANQRNLNLANASSMQDAINSTSTFAAAIDNNTRITGLSREAQLADIKARGENVQVQAAVMRMGEDGMLKYKNMSATFQGLGKNVNDLADEIFTGGVRTKEGSARIAALGTAGVDLEKAILLQKNAKTEQQKKEADEAMLKAKASTNDYMRSQAFLDLVQYGVGPVADSARAMMKENVEAQTVEAKRREEAAKGMPTDTVTIMKKMRDEAANARMTGTVTGKPTEQIGSDAAVAINKTNAAMKDAGAQISAVGFPKLVGAVDGATKSLGGFKGVIDSINTMKMSDADKNAKAIGNAVDGYLDKFKTPGGRNISPTEAATPAKPVSREKGSFGMTGSFLEDFGKGTPAILHGKESVVTEQQFNDLIGSLMPSAANSKMSMPSSDAIEKQLSMLTKNALPSFDKIIPDLRASMGMATQEMASKAAAMTKRTETVPPVQMPEIPRSAPTTSDQATTKDLLDAINQLNKQMGELVSHTRESVSVSEKIARTTKSSNRLVPV